MYQINIFGMGYVGLTFGVFASSFYKVNGIENNKIAAENIKNQNISIVDQGIEEGLEKSLSNGNLSIYNSINEISKGNKNVYMITPGTPLDSNGIVSLESIISISDELANIVCKDDLVILRSTVKVGTTAKLLAQRFSSMGVSVCFCPERTLEGVAIEELKTLPQIIGANKTKDYEKAKHFFESMGVKVLDKIKLEEAELAKLLCNSERDLYFALANEIALACEDLDISASNVIKSSTEGYSRSNIKIPGLVGGPCLEKDPYILKQSLPNFNFKLLTKSREIHESIIPNAIMRIKNNIQSNMEIKKISILGCAFKGFPITADVRGSLIYELRDQLLAAFDGVIINFHDFLADEVNTQDNTINASPNIEKTIQGADILILQNNHPSYKDIDWKELKLQITKDIIIYDFWSQLNIKDIEGLKYLSLGEG